jgi:HD-GYP domain-containing protein (c-di-GMP phosphodiesterase class II)
MGGKGAATLPIAPFPRTFPIKRRAENADDYDDSPSCADGAEIAAMTDTKLLLQRIAALRTRLDEGAEATADSVGAIEEKVQRGTVHNALIEHSLRVAETNEPVPATAMRLTARGVRLLRKGRELLNMLRDIADDAEFQRAEESDAVARLHHEGMAMIDLLLRTVQAFPPAVSVQLRMCDGLDVVLAEVEKRIAVLHSRLAHRMRESARIDELANYLRALAADHPVGLTPLLALATAVLDEARAGQPLRFLYASPTDPARFAAAHGLTVAQVLARLLLDDHEWAPQLQQALMAALVHDVGMVRVPAEALLTPGPLGPDERRLVEKHTAIAEAMLAKLWPGGGWTVDAAAQHHERSDGTGYPLGRRELQLSSFVKLLAVCDVYAALCSPRPHRAPLDTRSALTETLLLAERDCLDKAAAERLLLLSFYPVGSLVELNDGALAVVVATHPGERGMTQPSRPIVSLISDAQGQPLSWPSVVDLLENQQRSIVRALTAAERHAVLGKQFAVV